MGCGLDVGGVELLQFFDVGEDFLEVGDEGSEIAVIHVDAREAGEVGDSFASDHGKRGKWVLLRWYVENLAFAEVIGTGKDVAVGGEDDVPFIAVAVDALGDGGEGIAAADAVGAGRTRCGGSIGCGTWRGRSIRWRCSGGSGLWCGGTVRVGITNGLIEWGSGRCGGGWAWR